MNQQLYLKRDEASPIDHHCVPVACATPSTIVPVLGFILIAYLMIWIWD